jgi:hypothetical protein
MDRDDDSDDGDVDGVDHPALPISISSTKNIPPSSATIVPITTKSSSLPTSLLLLLSHEDRISIVRQHFLAKGYRVHSGLQFGCELVLYSDSPSLVHSDFCVHVPADASGTLDWRTLQTLVRMMPDLRKTLIVAHVVMEVMIDKDHENNGRYHPHPHDHGGDVIEASTEEAARSSSMKHSYTVQELAFSTEHAPFRHKHIPQGVGMQIKPQSLSQSLQKESD